MKTKKIPLVIYTVIVAGLTILGTRLYDSVSDTTDPAIANGPFWAGLCVKTDSKDGMNELHFKDTGEGIAKDVLPHIFETFPFGTFLVLIVAHLRIENFHRN